MPPTVGITEREIRERVAGGERLRGVFVVSSSSDLGAQHWAYVLTDRSPGYRLLRTHKERSDRAYRDLRRLLLLLREDFGYTECVPVYLAGDPELARFNISVPPVPDSGGGGAPGGIAPDGGGTAAAGRSGADT